MAFVYLLHFDEPYPAGRRPQHYIGVARDIEERVSQHRRGNPGKGGSLTRALKAKGIGFVVAASWEFAEPGEAFDHERQLKKRRHHASLCPLCKKIV